MTREYIDNIEAPFLLGKFLTRYNSGVKSHVFLISFSIFMFLFIFAG